ncbi:hypothetical protein [Sorangium sp. So ce1335]|uniref:hypothetical protein n=1 Tax=Sorangium sp. So ce1335 TaxID=3133335 RepID=UPI003F63ED67
MTSRVEFTCALAASERRIHVSGRLEAMPPDAEFSRLFRYEPDRPQPWTKHDVHWATVGYAKYHASPGADPVVCALSEEGDVELDGAGSRVVERIPEAGLRGPTSRKLGYVSSIRQIGNHLYVCGDGGQAYKRLGPATWVRMDEGLLQKADEPHLLLLNAIDGAAEDDLYVAGDLPGPSGREARLHHWNGSRWQRIKLPSVGPLRAIHIENQQRVWLAGARGALLVGNHRTGFSSLWAYSSPQVFHDLTWYEGTLYLGSNFGLFKYDEARRRVVRARTDLAVDLSYVHTVDHAGGVLWCVGPKDIARFDGETWTRIHHPDNPRSGEES